jgi:hypothetical protein
VDVKAGSGLGKGERKQVGYLQIQCTSKTIGLLTKDPGRTGRSEGKGFPEAQKGKCVMRRSAIGTVCGTPVRLANRPSRPVESVPPYLTTKTLPLKQNSPSIAHSHYVCAIAHIRNIRNISGDTEGEGQPGTGTTSDSCQAV